MINLRKYMTDGFCLYIRSEDDQTYFGSAYPVVADKIEWGVFK